MISRFELEPRCRLANGLTVIGEYLVGYTTAFWLFFGVQVVSARQCALFVKVVFVCVHRALVTSDGL